MALSLDGTTGISASGNIVGNNISVGGSLTVGSFSPSVLNVSGNITGGNILTSGSVSAAGNITGLNINSSNADLAEMYVSDNDYAPGTVVEFGGQYEITATTQSHSTQVAGIISTAPSYLMNANQLGQHVAAVALIGRVPCRVIGTIAKGDRLVAGDLAGVAQRLDPGQYQPACIIGKALEAYNSEEIGTIEVAVGRT